MSAENNTPETDEAREDRLFDCECAGFTAADMGEVTGANPSPPESEEATRWMIGYQRARYKQDRALYETDAVYEWDTDLLPDHLYG